MTKYDILSGFVVREWRYVCAKPTIVGNKISWWYKLYLRFCIFLKGELNGEG